MACEVRKLDLGAFLKLPRRRVDKGCCAICHETFDGALCTFLPCSTFSSCPAFFHGECVLDWLDRKLTCPLCRRSFDLELGSNHTMSSDCLPQLWNGSPARDVATLPSESWDGAIHPEWRVLGGEQATEPSMLTHQTPTANRPPARRVTARRAAPFEFPQSLPSPSMARTGPARSPVDVARRPTPLRSASGSQARSVNGSAPASFASSWSGRSPVMGIRRVTESDGPRRFFTQMSRVDGNTRRSIEVRVAALHRARHCA